VRWLLRCEPRYLLTDDYRLTYNATLAELTSLEEMMRYMMDDDDNRIHSDVVNKLWQAYSKYVITLF
jgi:hypothetical protein